MNDTDRIAAIRAREAAATPGPWHGPHDPDIDMCARFGDYGWTAGSPDGNGPEYDVDSEQGKADSEFIAHAREDTPWLVDQLEQAHAWFDQLESAAGYGSLADVVAHQESRGLRGDHATCLRAQRIQKLIATVTEESEWRHQVLGEAVERTEQLEAERDRARATAVALEQDAAKARAERDEALRELRTESDERLRLTEAIQRVRDIPMKGNQVASDEWDEGYLACEADVQRALDKEDPDGQ